VQQHERLALATSEIAEFGIGRAQKERLPVEELHLRDSTPKAAPALERDAASRRCRSAAEHGADARRGLDQVIGLVGGQLLSALESPTLLLIIGGEPGEAYRPPV
jgi:hypothetical protein